MDNPSIEIIYKLANGKRVRIDVTIEVKELLEQADRQIRAQRRQDRRYLDFFENVDELESHTASLDDIVNNIIKADSYRELYSAVSTLPKTQRKWVHLYYGKKLTFQQIAEIEGIHHTTVMRVIKQARKMLRKRL